MLKKLLDKLIYMDKDIRTWTLLGYFFVLEFFILFFFSPWLMFLPFIFIWLLIYTSSKAEEIELNKQNESV